MNPYWRSTRSPLYSFLFSIPLFLIYEIGILLTSADDMLVLRNGADALMRQILATFGVSGLYWMGGLFFVGFVIAFMLQRKFWQETRVHGDYLLLMMGESLAWSVMIYYFMSNVSLLLMNPTGSLLIQRVTLAVGAGIYEELIFRVILVTALFWALHRLCRVSRVPAYALSAVLAALVFSGFHYVGALGDVWTWPSFLFRFIAGLVLSGLYITRGYGITAYAHALYDLLVTFKAL